MKCPFCGRYRRNPDLSPEQQRILSHINMIIEGQTTYGYTIWQVKNKRKAAILIWYNSTADWTLRSVTRQDKPPLRLDANYVVVPYTVTEIKAILAAGGKLSPLPLYKGSFEYKTKVLEYDPIGGFTLTSDDEVMAMLRIKCPKLEELRKMRDSMPLKEFLAYLAATYQISGTFLARMADWVG